MRLSDQLCERGLGPRRIELDCELYCELWDEPIAYPVTDVSEDGLWIQTDLLLETGTEVTLTFVPPDWDEPLCVAGRVERVQLDSHPRDGAAVGMGIQFDALRNDERRRLTHSMRCLRAEQSFILGQRTLSGVPVGVAAPREGSPVGRSSQTLAGWQTATEPTARPTEPPSQIGTQPPDHRPSPSSVERGFPGGLDLATSVFSRGSSD